jgi:FtsH-binding integral membrane protein
MESSGVFKRTWSDSVGKELSEATYNLVIGGVLFYGFLINWLMVQFIPVESIAAVNPILFFIGYFACCMGGCALFVKSDNPAISFLGYNLVVVPFGFIINLVVHQYQPALVVEAVRVTAMVTFLMMGLGSLFPAFFRKIAGALFIALIAVIVVELVQVFIFRVNVAWVDWAVALIFCGYIGYDWGRANSIPRTLDNAVDSAAALYMDIINLFLRILRILGRRR